MSIYSKKIAGIRVSAVVETIVLIGLVLLADVMFGAGDRFIHIHPHPFWLILLMVCFHYTVLESLLCAVLLCAGLYLGNLPAQQLDQTSFEYWLSICQAPALWFIAAGILGGLSTLRQNRLSEAETDLDHAKAKAEAIAKNYQRLEGLNQQLELRLAEEWDSAVKLYEALGALQNVSPDNQFAAFEHVISSVIDANEFSVFSLGEKGLLLASSHAWKDHFSYSHDFLADSAIYNAIVRDRRILSVTSPEDAVLLSGQGILAGPLIDAATDKVYGMLQINAMPFEKVTIRALKRFAILCNWLGTAWNDIKSKADEAHGKAIQRGYGSLSPALFEQQQDLLVQLAHKADFDLCRVTIAIAGEATGPSRELLASLAGSIRPKLDDLAQFFGPTGEGKYILLLPFTDEHRAHDVIDSVQEELKKDPSVEKLKLSFSTTPLHMADHD